MSAAQLVVRGIVSDFDSKSGNGQNGPWTMHLAYMVGLRESYEIVVPDQKIADVIKAKEAGTDVEVTVTASANRYGVQYRLVDLVDLDELATSGSRSA